MPRAMVVDRVPRVIGRYRAKGPCTHAVQNRSGRQGRQDIPQGRAELDPRVHPGQREDTIMASTTIRHTGTVKDVKRLRSSVSGNARYSIRFEEWPGRLQTKRDAAWVIALVADQLIGKEVTFRTNANQDTITNLDIKEV